MAAQLVAKILAGAWNNNRCFLKVNKRGKGLVQSVRGLAMAPGGDNCRAFSGRDINKAGIAPDVVVGLTDAQSLAAQRDKLAHQQTNTLKRWKS